jgi:hypothetical protein
MVIFEATNKISSLDQNPAKENTRIAEVEINIVANVIGITTQSAHFSHVLFTM